MKHIIIAIIGIGVIISAGFLLVSDEVEEKPVVELSPTYTYTTTEIAQNITITPISHASAVLNWNGTVIYADPVGNASMYANQPKPNVVFITHEHGDHFDKESLQALLTAKTTVFAPAAVVAKMPEGLPGNIVTLSNGDEHGFGLLTISAVPAYNIRQEALQNHPEGRDNGYIISDGVTRVYFSGDSEDTSEMRDLKNITAAFIAMNLPYTMSVEKAAEAVLAFAPDKVYPYHFRTPDGFSDVEKFKTLVNEGNPNIEVNILDWYSEI